MDVVTLPIVTAQTTVDDALELLRKHERSGVVQVMHDTYRLLYVGDLLKARADRVARCEWVSGGDAIVVLNPDLTVRNTLERVLHQSTLRSFELQLGRLGLSYAFAGRAPRIARIVTLYEAQTDTLRTPGAYRCTGTPRHYYPMPRVTVGQPCPRYPECTRSDQKIPVIEVTAL